MARKPQRSTRSSRCRAPHRPPPGGSERERIIAALMALLAEKRIEEIGFGDIRGAPGSRSRAARRVRQHPRDPRRAHEGARPQGAGRR